MENRENRSSPTDLDRDESESSFNESSGSQDWSDQPSRSSGSGGMQSDKGRSSNIESDSDLGSIKGFGESGNVNRGSSDIEE